jgi:glycerate dehydrogenase
MALNRIVVNGQQLILLAAPMGELKNKTLTIVGKGEIGLSLAKAKHLA